MLSLYAAVGRRSFRRYSTYTAATLAGIFTNSVFGVIISFAYIAVWRQNPDAGGYDVTDAVTYCWLAQAMIMTVAIWNGGTTDDVAERIRTGDVAIDLYRPVSLLGWFLAGDLGRAAYHLLTRGVAPTVVGALLFDSGQLHALSWLAMLALAYNMIVAFILCHWIWFEIVSRASATVSSLGTLSIPVVGVFSSMLILGERPDWREYAALLLVLAAIATVLVPVRRKS